MKESEIIYNCNIYLDFPFVLIRTGKLNKEMCVKQLAPLAEMVLD